MNVPVSNRYYDRLIPTPECHTLCCDIGERRRLVNGLTQRLTEYELMTREVHHRIKNNIATVGAVLSLQMDSTEDPTVRDALAQAKRRVVGMHLLYEILQESSTFTEISIQQYAESLINAVTELSHGTTEVIIERQIESFSLDTRSVYPLGLALTELFTNAMKYAFVGRKTGRVLIRVERHADRLTLTVEDDGIGLPQDHDPRTPGGLGLSIVDQLACGRDGCVEVANRCGRPGVRAVVEFGLKPPGGQAKGRTPK